jgi:RNA polymerase sigma-70 factor (ECF subfamily)
MRATYTEAELIAGCLQNDRLWQERMYRQYFATLLSTCLRYTDDRDLALQMLNDGMLRVFNKIHLFQATGSLEGWMRRIVFRAVADHFRKHRHDIRFIEMPEYDQPAIKAESEELLLAEDLLKLIQQLPESTRRVFLKFAVDGYSHREIAQEFKISEGTSKWHVSQAREFLQKALATQSYGAAQSLKNVQR